MTNCLSGSHQIKRNRGHNDIELKSRRHPTHGQRDEGKFGDNPERQCFSFAKYQEATAPTDIIYFDSPLHPPEELELDKCSETESDEAKQVSLVREMAQGRVKFDDHGVRCICFSKLLDDRFSIAEANLRK